jgi:hypothetical protein
LYLAALLRAAGQGGKQLLRRRCRYFLLTSMVLAIALALICLLVFFNYLIIK